jgi:hypothetical protein
MNPSYYTKRVRMDEPPSKDDEISQAKRSPCNGWNHPVDCQCNFRGGHPKARVPPGWEWKAIAVRRYQSRVRVKCPKCSRYVYRIPGNFPGQLMFDNFGPPWPPHICRLIIRKTLARKKLLPRRGGTPAERWLPFQICEYEISDKKTSILGKWSISPRTLRLVVSEVILLSKNMPSHLRTSDKAAGAFELSFFPSNGSAPITVMAYNAAIDLFLK